MTFYEAMMIHKRKEEKRRKTKKKVLNALHFVGAAVVFISLVAVFVIGLEVSFGSCDYSETIISALMCFGTMALGTVLLML